MEWYEKVAERITKMILDRQTQCWPFEDKDKVALATMIRYEYGENKGNVQDKKAIAIMKNISDGFDERGHFIQKFARMFSSANDKQKECLLPSAHKLIVEYKIEEQQKEKGILYEAQYM